MNNSAVRKTFWKSLMVFLMSEIASSVAIMIDGIMISRFQGGYAIAAHGITAPYTTFMLLIGGVFSSGTQVVCAKFIGAGKKKEANETFQASAALILVGTVVLTILMLLFSKQFALLFGAGKDAKHLLKLTSDYLAGLGLGLTASVGTTFLMPLMQIDDDQKRSVFAINTMLIVNIAGDFLNVFVFHGGMFGMAIATTVSYYASFIVLLLHFLKKDTFFHFYFRKIHFSYLKNVFSTGLPYSFGRAASALRSLYMNYIIILLASTEALSGYSVYSNVKFFLQAFCVSIGPTVLQLGAIFIGEEDKNALKTVFETAMKSSIVVGGIISAVVFCFSPQLVSIYLSGEALRIGIQIMRLFAISIPAIGIRMYFTNYFQAFKQLKLTYASYALTQFVLVALIATVLSCFMGASGIWVAIPLSEYAYLLLVFGLICKKCGHFPKTIDDFLMLPKKFDVPNEDKIELSVCTMEQVVELSKTASVFFKEKQFDKRRCFVVSLAVEEMVGNIIQHGFNDKKPHSVDVKLMKKEDKIIVRIRDDCMAFDVRKRYETMDVKDKVSNVGLRIVFGMTEDVQYLYFFNLNNLIIKV